MRKKKPAKKQREYDLMVLKVLKELSKTPEARLSVREISRTLSINPMAVSRSVKRLNGLLDIKKGSSFESFRLQIHLIRLKSGLESLSLEELVKKSYLSGRLNHEVFG